MLTMKLSIVVPTHNRLASLKLLIKSIEVLNEPPNEVIIINDGSEDGTKEFLNLWIDDSHAYTAISHSNPCPLGPGAARNIGIALSESPLIAFTDDDCTLHKTWVKVIKHSKIWNQNKNIIGIGGKVLSRRKGLVGEYFTFHKILEPPTSIAYLVTANACYQKASLLEVNGFDEIYRFPGGEDCGLCLKLVENGFRFGYEPNMIVWHDYRTSLVEFMRTFYRYGKGCAETVSYHFNTKAKT
jgi:glycosyltransferase involved in cell wall biosynthesis